MQPNYRSVEEIFSGQARLVVPLFQRPYVWNEEEQWQPLWEDIAGLLHRISRDEPAQQYGGRKVASHFLGTIVLDQKQSATGEHMRRAVIDGQQRLTTLQIVLKSAILAMEQIALEAASSESVAADDGLLHSLARETDLLTQLVANRGVAGSEEIFKVWPTNDDRDAFRRVMETTADALPEPRHQLEKALHFFVGRFRQTLETSRLSPAVISRSLRNEMKIIVVDLEPGDEPQAIFETLNAHGQPLLPADLIKNWLLWEAAREAQRGSAIDVEMLYNEFWSPFDRDVNYWRRKVGTGHAAKVRVDLFFQYWLTLELRRPISHKTLYQSFLDYADRSPFMNKGRLDLPSLMERISVYAGYFRTIDRGDGEGRWATMTQRLGTMNLVAFTPLLMEALAKASGDTASLEDFAVPLESYLIRRMFTGSSTRGYNSLVIQLLDDVFPQGESEPNTLSESLANREDTLEWPNDATFRAAWQSRPIYAGTKKRVAMVLRAIETQMSTASGFDDPIKNIDWSKTQIEHVMPQSWQDHYPLDEDTEESRAERKLALDRIGNLTLISGRLNQSYQNAQWNDDAEQFSPTDRKTWGKRRHLKSHSNLRLNTDLLEHAANDFSENHIAMRSERLAEYALALWPRPQHP